MDLNLQVLPTVLLAQAASAPVYASPGGSRAAAGRPRPPPDALLLGFIITAVVLARFAVFDAVQFALASKPPEGVLLGALVLVLGAAAAPLVWVRHRHNQVGLAWGGTAG